MDMKEASAMTEASGLSNDPAGVEQASGAGKAASTARVAARRMPRCAGPISCAR